MSINNENLRNVAQAALDIMTEKKLHPNQQKLDVHEPEKDELTADDFKKLRAMKKEETEQVDEAMQKADVPAYLRKQKGEKPLSVADVKAPRKDSISASENLAKARNEEVEELDEAEIEKTATGMRVYGSSYGNSQRARREQVKKSIDTAKGPKMKDISDIEAEKKKKKKFSESLEIFKESGIKGLFGSFIKEEPDNETFAKEVEENKKKAAGEAKQADVAKASVKAVQSEEVEQLDELTGKGKLPQIAAYHKQKGDEAKGKMETIRNTNRTVPVPKEKSAKIYAKDAESTYHYTQAKRAKALMAKEEVEQLDELSPGTLKSYIKGAKANKKFEADTQNTAMRKDDHMMASDAAEKVAKRKEGIKTAKAKLNAEEVEQIDELSLDTLKSAAQKNADKAYEYHMDDNKHWARKSASRALNLKAKIARKERQMKANEEVEQVEERSLTDAEMKKRETIVKSMKKGLSGFKERYGERAKEVMYATATKQAKKD